MYKKITHNIVEEHFAHPIAAELKKKVDKMSPAGAPPYKQKSKIAAATPEAMLYLAANELVGKLTWGIRNYLISALSGIDDAEYIQTRLLKDITDFGPVLTTYYSKKIGDDSVMHLTEFAKVFVEIVSTAKAGKDISKLVTTALGHLDELATVLGNANPKFWPKEVVKEYLNQFATHVLEEITARMKKDWEADTIASMKANDIMMSGPITEGVLKGMPDFANVFASGIIRQFPNIFPESKEE
jgi:hypothetical protein